VEPKLAPEKIDFEGALHTRGAYFHSFHTNGHIGHTCVGPQKLRWPRAPRSLNLSLRIRLNICLSLLQKESVTGSTLRSQEQSMEHVDATITFSRRCN